MLYRVSSIENETSESEASCQEGLKCLLGFAGRFEMSVHFAADSFLSDIRNLDMSEKIKPDAKSQAMIYFQILGRLSRYTWRTAQDICDSLRNDGVPVRLLTVQRAIKLMREDPLFCLECNDGSKPFGYRLRKDSPFAQGELTPSESLLLRMAQQYLKYQLPAAVTRSLAPMFDESRVVLPAGKTKTPAQAWRSKVAVVPNQLPFVAPKILPRIFNAVSEALYLNRELVVVYCSLGNQGEERRHTVQPLGIVQQDVRVYLVCRYAGQEDVRHLALHRIRSAEVSENSFAPPRDFSLDQYLSSRHFNYTGKTVRRVRLTIELTEPAAVRTLEETPFDASQTIEQLEEGRWRITAEMPDSRLIEGWLAMWSDDSGIVSVRKEILEASPESVR